MQAYCPVSYQLRVIQSYTCHGAVCAQWSYQSIPAKRLADADLLAPHLAPRCLAEQPSSANAICVMPLLATATYSISRNASSRNSDISPAAQVKPMREDQLVSGSGDMHKIVNLATLSDSLDYLADAIQHFGDSQQPRQSATVCCNQPPSYCSKQPAQGTGTLLCVMFLPHCGFLIHVSLCEPVAEQTTLQLCSNGWGMP